MGRMVELPSIKPRSKSRRQGLRKLSPDLISKARDETATEVTRLGLTFLGTTAFCLPGLLTNDQAILTGTEKINLQFVGEVSFFGFMLLAPTVLIVLRVYLQIYVEHSDRLDRLARSMSVVRAPTLQPLRNPMIRNLSGMVLYLLLPYVMLLFAWKAALFPAWGSALLCVATGVVVSHVMLPFSRFSWRSKALLSVSAAIIAGGLMLHFGPLQRPYDLTRANLSGQSLMGGDFSKADLSFANLSVANLSVANLNGANLHGANLSGANLNGAILRAAILRDANLSGANLNGAILRDANLPGANLRGADLGGADLRFALLADTELGGANLRGANLSDANLNGADLSEARNLTQTQLDEACGNSNTKLLEGLTLKPCPTD